MSKMRNRWLALGLAVLMALPTNSTVAFAGQQAEVVAVGPGGMVDGKEVKMEVAVGDQVIYSKYAGTEVKLDGEEYIIVKQDDILAICE